ncbi:hypothetical protein CD30_09365 [Ureibacillus massiliensis 4400831 = CIP 108448 = CCUG 49529]|uniref:Uncharacterized protein n=1 Tax=Ureibacillus massiliensis 4400831 = CIP 108448 = CCUG 49529 TaxID=1211035 RepID=A0A0A3JV73_9BACL|nr:hypothetical protein [Ureibacillus massiliensis]KGR90902.1 hypothetical protein CD30_09365 [Ureibacillus massiliensis 4400831 = CIP 108448 = CCUG 49529]
MKKLVFIFVVLLIIGVLAFCNDSEPDIEIEATISPISEYEYNILNYKDGAIDDYKLFKLDFHMKHDDSVKEREIYIPDLMEIFNNIDDIARFDNGNGSEQDNQRGNFATYNRIAVFYSKGLSNNDIKEVFSDEKITVAWVNGKNEKVEMEYTIADFIEFSSEPG